MKINQFVCSLLFAVTITCIACGGTENTEKSDKKEDASKKSIAAADLAGEWVSASDPKSEIQFKDSLFIEKYNGTEVSRNAFEFHSVCSKEDCNAEGADLSALSCFTSKGQFDISCYKILSFEGNQLEIAMIGAAAPSLTYKRK